MAISSEKLDRIAKRAAISVVLMASKRGDAHIASSLSCIDGIVAAFEYLRERKLVEISEFVLSKGHGATALYAVMAEYGILEHNELDSFNTSGTKLGIHPSRKQMPYLSVATGSLGHGIPFTAGLAMANKIHAKKTLSICLVGDGELNEGSNWEGCQFASQNNLENLLVLVDFNRIQSVARYEEISGSTTIQDKFKSFGWDTKIVPSHNPRNIYEILNEAESNAERTKPMAIILDSITGYRVSFMESKVLWHYRKPDNVETIKALEELDAAEIAPDILEVFK